MPRRILFAALVTGTLIATGVGIPQAAAVPTGSLGDGSIGGPVIDPPGGGAVTDRAMSLRFDLPSNQPVARTYSLKVTPTNTVCASHENGLQLERTVPAGATGGTLEGVLAFLRDANPFNGCAYVPSAVTWDAILTTRLGVQLYKILFITQSGNNSVLVNPDGETDVAAAMERTPSGVAFKVK